MQVIELVPPYVQTELLSAEQANNPMAMPLKDFIAETMQILETQSEVAEVIVESAKQQRFAAEGGMEGYDAFFKNYNDTIAAMMPA